MSGCGRCRILAPADWLSWKRWPIPSSKNQEADMSTLNTPEEAEAYVQGLKLGSDQWVVRCYEIAIEAFDEDAMTLAADEMQRRNLDF